MSGKLRHIKEYEDYGGFKQRPGEGYEIFTNKSGEKFWGDMAAGVLPIAMDTGRILVGLRSKYVNEPGTWGGFGGEVDTDREKQDPSLAAKRELEEEAGGKGDFEVVPAYIFKSEGGGFEYHNFIGLVPREFKPMLDWETEKAEWITLDELIDLKDKHFGLEALLDNSMDIIKKYAR